MHIRPPVSLSSLAVVLITGVLSLLHMLIGNDRRFMRWIRHTGGQGDGGNVQALSVYYKRVTAFLLLGLTPIAVIRYVARESLSRYGLNGSNGRLGLLYIPVVILAFVILVLFSRKSTLYRRYPEVRNATTSPLHFTLNCLTYAIYFFGYESMYRGFLLFGLERTAGLWPAVLVSTGFNGLMHLRTPPTVIIGSLASGLLFAHMVVVAGSIWPVFALHTCIGIGMDALCVRSVARTIGVVRRQRTL